MNLVIFSNCVVDVLKIEEFCRICYFSIDYESMGLTCLFLFDIDSNNSKCYVYIFFGEIKIVIFF